MKKLFNVIISITFFLVTGTIQAYENIQVEMKKNLFEQYITAYDNGVVICPNVGDPKVKERLKHEFADYLEKARLGSDKADYLVSLGYLNGIGTQLDTQEGIRWLRKAVAKNYTPAKLLYISMLIFKKKIISSYVKNFPNEQETLNWVKQESEKGNLNSQFLLALIYMETNKLQQAYVLVSPLAKKGHAQFQYLMGNIFFYGFGFPVDYSKASYWYQQALQHDPPLVISGMMAGNLMDIYSKPEFRNPKKAEYWENQLKEIVNMSNCRA